MNCPLCSAPESRRFAETADSSGYRCCARCELIWLEPARRLSCEEERTHYLTHENHGPSYLNYLLKTAGPVVAQLAKGANGLDYGCGPSEGMKELLSPLGFRVDSFDPVFFPRSLPKNHYDFLLCNEAAEHFYEPGEEFARMDSLVKTGALIGIRSALAPAEGTFSSWYYRKDPTHVVFYREATVMWLAGRLGWELLQLVSPLWLMKKR